MCAGSIAAPHRAAINAAADALVEGRNLNLFELVAEVQGARGVVMAHEPAFIFPDLQDHEAIRPRGFRAAHPGAGCTASLRLASRYRSSIVAPETTAFGMTLT